MAWNIGASLSDLGDWFAEKDKRIGGGVTGLTPLQNANEGFGNWYEGPGGESATKIGLALMAMFGPGAAFAGGGTGGELFSGGGGGGGSGGVLSQYGPQAIGNLSKLAGGSEDDADYSMKKRRGILGAQAAGSGLFSAGDLIDPAIAKVMYDSIKSGA